jgi:Domain of unknown function (DUF4184)
MPFPLAHPAAVLPLRRYCPRWLSFPGLVIGSVCPDAGYLFGRWHWDDLSHQLLGSVGFCLPMGIVLLVLFYGLRLPLVRMLPASYQQAFIELCQRPRGSIWAMIISLLIGAWTHLLLDSFTHKDGWFVQHLPILESSLFTVAGRGARVCHLLWYGCSFAGMVWLFLAFERWKRANVSGCAETSGTVVLRDGVLVAILVVPIELAHHLIQDSKLGLCLVAGLCALPVIWIVLKVASAEKGTTANQTAAETPAETRDRTKGQ